MKQPFFMVWGDHAGGPTRQHATFEEAKAEVERLAGKAPHATWHILECVATASPLTPALNWQSKYIPEHYSITEGDTSD